MSPSVLLGLLLALGTALASVLGFLFKHRGAVNAPQVDFRRPIHSSVALFAAPAYTIGVIVATTGWGFHVGALALAPISLVQAVIAGGLVLLTVTADRLFGQEVSRREWIGVALTAAGLAILAATIEGSAKSAHSHYHAATLTLYLALLSGTAVAVWALATRSRRPGLTLAVSAGLMWGASDVSIKALSGRLGHSSALSIIVHPLALAILVLSLVGLLVSARSLQIGPAVPVIALTSAAGNVVTILAGPIVFGEPMPSGPLGVTLRILAFVLVIGAAALTPPPEMRAEPEPV